jgi:uncharacterized protein (TIGR02118 family)
MFKVIGTAYKRDDLSTEEFFRYWRDVHAPISAQVEGLRGYVVSEVVSKLQGDLEADAFVEQWYSDEETYRRAEASPEMASAWDDVPKYAKMSGTFWVVRDHVYIPPPITGPGTLSSQAWLA